MAQPALHFAVGATCMTAVTLAVGPLRRRWYRLGPLAATAGGLWACAPDVDHLWRALSWLPGAGTIGNLEYSHAYSLLANLVFFHGWMDRYLRGWDGWFSCTPCSSGS